MTPENCGLPALPDGADRLSLHIMAKAGIRVGTLNFRLSYNACAEEKILCADWLPRETRTPDFAELSKNFADTPFTFELPEQLLNFGLLIEKIGFSYAFVKGLFEFHLVVCGYGSFVVATWQENNARAFRFTLELNQSIPLSVLPVIGAGAGREDAVSLGQFTVTVSTDGDLTLGARLSLHIAALGAPLEIEFPGESRTNLPQVRNADESAVKWIDLNKTIGPLRLARLGFRLSGGNVTVLVDAGIQMSILLLEVLGLSLTLPLKLDEFPSFSMEGVAITVNRPPLYISGGLCISDEQGMTLYTGRLSVKVSRFQLTALGSYGAFEGGTPSLFAFLMLGLPLGGPPIFFVTGLAAGFGYNRAIRLPSDVKKVREFPFVAAAMGEGKLKSDMTPGQVLRQMNEAISPCADQYFATAGVRFTSFGMLESFLLVNIAFGQRVEISLLGLSSLSLPPKSSNPFVRLTLALMAVLIPEEGYLTVQGALTSDSYVLFPECKATGGFALSVWYGSNKHSGDFIVTLGGYKDGYSVAHYPTVDRIGINWRMARDLTLRASFYFALTPACVMMGGRLAIDYVSGRLKAWFHAYIDFFMKWKPFSYTLNAGISIGASYRWDFFPFYTTFTVELGADLALWGPPFGGKVHVSWFIISFTISFGGGKPNPPPLSWSEFASAFLGQDSTTNAPASLIDVRGVSGVVRERVGDLPPHCSAEELILEVVTQLPVTKAALWGDVCAVTVASDTLGIVPMGLARYVSTLHVTVTDPAGHNVAFEWEEIKANLPRALWDQAEPDPYSPEPIKPQQVTGLRLRSPRPALPESVLPNEASGYSMAILCRNEPLRTLSFSWTAPSPAAPEQYPGEDRLKYMEETIMAEGRSRACFLDGLAHAFGTAGSGEIHMETWQDGLSELLFGVPTLNHIGAYGIEQA